jgi:lipid A 3-O-deacylase
MALKSKGKIIAYIQESVLKKLSFIFWFSIAHFFVTAQVIDNLASFRTMSTNRYIRLHYENDYFSETDIYYTQGGNLEWVAPALEKFPISKLLITASENKQYGIALEHEAYTPTSIQHSDILYGDRPFAAAVFLKTFAMSNHPGKRLRVTSALSLGVIGQASGARWIQETIHRWIHDTNPKGWNNQIQNDVVLNYEAGVEKNFFHFRNYFLVNGFAGARAGTLSDKASLAAVFMLGKINPAITSMFSDMEMKKSKFNFHFYFQPVVSSVFYDATLQGGVFRESPYTLSFDQVSRFTLQGNAGVVFYIKSVYLEYFQSYITKEFNTGTDHHWGGIRIGVNF